MIRFILLQNRQGKTRLSRWYVAYNEADRKKIETETHRTIVQRDNKMTNFLEVSEQPAKRSRHCSQPHALVSQRKVASGRVV